MFNISDDVAPRITAQEVLNQILKYGKIVAKAGCAAVKLLG